MEEILSKATLTDYIALGSSFITLLALMAAVYQIRQNTKVYKANTYRESVVRAVDLARHFQEHLVNNISIILEVYEKSGLSKIVSECVSTEANYEFTKSELEKLFNRSIIASYIENRKKLDDDSFLSSASHHLKCNNHQTGEDNTLSPSQKFMIIHNDTRNTIEWMAMLINTGAADSAVIFQSLHQLIVLYIRLSYFDLCLTNRSSIYCDKLFTNTIKLYTDWNAVVTQQTKSQMKKKDAASKKINQIERAYQNSKDKHITSPKKIK